MSEDGVLALPVFHPSLLQALSILTFWFVLIQELAQGCQILCSGKLQTCWKPDTDDWNGSCVCVQSEESCGRDVHGRSGECSCSQRHRLCRWAFCHPLDWGLLPPDREWKFTLGAGGSESCGRNPGYSCLHCTHSTSAETEGSRTDQDWVACHTPTWQCKSLLLDEGDSVSVLYEERKICVHVFTLSMPLLPQKKLQPFHCTERCVHTLSTNLRALVSSFCLVFKLDHIHSWVCLLKNLVNDFNFHHWLLLYKVRLKSLVCQIFVIRWFGLFSCLSHLFFSKTPLSAS